MKKILGKIAQFFLTTMAGKIILESVLEQFKEFLIFKIENSNSSFMRQYKTHVISFINEIDLKDFIKKQV